MNIRTRVKLLVITVAALAGALFAGCKIGEQTADEFLEENGAKNQAVTYYANGGSFNGRTEKSLYYRAGQEIILDFSATKTDFSYSGFVFTGWYYVEMKDGEPVFEDENKTVPVSSGVKVDMTQPLYIKENEHLYLCADWGLDYRLEYILVTEDDSAITTADGEIKANDILRWDAFGTSNVITPSSLEPVASTSHTFLALYADKECTELFTGSFQRPTEDGAENPKVYAKYIKGNWTVVKNAIGVSNMLSNGGKNQNFYLFNDIDCKGISIGLFTGEFNSVIAGNGHVLYNLSIEQKNLSSGSNFAMFGELAANASITDLTIKDVNIETSVRPNANLEIFLFAVDVKDGAEIENVSIQNVSLTVIIDQDRDDRAVVGNIQYIGGEYVTGNWMCGGVNSSDIAFLEKYTGLEIINATLKMGKDGAEELVAAYRPADE